MSLLGAPEVRQQLADGLLNLREFGNDRGAINYREISRYHLEEPPEESASNLWTYAIASNASIPMKKLTFILILFPTILFCQEPPKAAESPAETPEPATDGTTVEEWLYATEGYTDDVSKGKDPEKEGYTFEKTHTLVTEDFFTKEKKGRPTYT